MNVFISYAHEDAKWADSIRQVLRESKETSRFEVWNRELELQPGENWALKLGKALEASDAMVVLLSPQSVKSPFVRQEIDFALTQPKFRDRLISVMVKPTRDIPWILRTLPFIDATGGKEEAFREVASALTASLENEAAKR
jgi:hypothetical protein